MYSDDSDDGESEDEVLTFAAITLAACAPLFDTAERVQGTAGRARVARFITLSTIIPMCDCSPDELTALPGPSSLGVIYCEDAGFCEESLETEYIPEDGGSVRRGCILGASVSVLGGAGSAVFVISRKVGLFGGCY